MLDALDAPDARVARGPMPGATRETTDGAPLQAVIFDDCRSSVEERKGRDPATPMFGADLFVDELVHAFLRYGTAERYIFFKREFTEVLRKADGFALTGRHADAVGVAGASGTPGAGRTAVVHAGHVEALRGFERAVLFSFRPQPQNFVPLRRQLGKGWPIVSVIHALGGVSIPELVCQLLTRETLAQDAVVCSTDAGRRVLLNLLEQASMACAYNPTGAPPPAVRLPVIPIGVDAGLLHGDRGEARHALGLDQGSLGLDQESTILLSVGRLTPHTKADLGPLLCCFRELRRRTDRPLLLIVAGDDTRHRMAEELRAYARALDCALAVQVWPDVSVDTKRLLYQAADIFVAPSDNIQETFGIALVEAQCAGLPIVASDWSGFREIVDDGVTGFLVPTYWLDTHGALELTSTPLTMKSRNAVLAGMTIVDDEALCARLCELITHAELRRRMGERARVSACRRFDWSTVIPRYESLFNELLAYADPGGEGCAQGPFTYDVQRIFSHYPRHVLSPDTEVALSTRGRQWLSSPFPLSTLADYPLDAGDVGGVLRALADAAGAGVAAASDSARAFRIQEILDALGSYHELGAAWVVSRLLKYGLLRVVERVGCDAEVSAAGAAGAAAGDGDLRHLLLSVDLD